MGFSLAVFPLSFKEVTVFLGAVHLITRVSALQSRIKDFQRRGFPPGLNTGKGRAAEYGPEHVILLGVAFELLELGMAPDRICNLLQPQAETIIAEIRRIVLGGRQGIFKQKNTLLYFDPGGLDELRDDPEAFPDSQRIVIGSIAEFSRYWVDPAAGSSRHAVINLIEFVSDLVIGIAGAKACADKLVIYDLVSWGMSE